MSYVGEQHILHTGRPVGVRRNRPQVHVDGPWRGGQIVSLSETEAVIKLHLEHSIIGTRTVDLDLFDCDCPRTLGDPVVCRVQGDGADSYVITEVRKSTFAGSGPRDQAASLAAGEFHPGVITEREGFQPVYPPDPEPKQRGSDRSAWDW